MFIPQRILLPTDFSECDGHCSLNALKQAVALAHHHGSELIFLHVINEDINQKQLFFIDYDKKTEIMKKMVEKAEEEIQHLINTYAADIKEKCSVVVRIGSPVKEILAEEKEKGVDLIVIATRGATGFQGVFYGSVTEKVVRHATCSVLVSRKLINRNPNKGEQI